jgi:Holliday junction resolvase-like predicted endonuclease
MQRSTDSPGADHRTSRRRAGDAAEGRVAVELRRRGWSIIARQVRVGRDELDLVALDPGPPAFMVVVEVRSRRSPRFGTQEERLDEAKVHRLYRAMATLRARGCLPDGLPLPHGLDWRVDLVALDADAGRLRHLRGLIPR